MGEVRFTLYPKASESLRSLADVFMAEAGLRMRAQRPLEAAKLAREARKLYREARHMAEAERQGLAPEVVGG